MSLVELGRFPTPVEADLARLRLEAEGIIAILFDATSFYSILASGVRLMVDEEDLAEALKILRG